MNSHLLGFVRRHAAALVLAMMLLGGTAYAVGGTTSSSSTTYYACVTQHRRRLRRQHPADVVAGLRSRKATSLRGRRRDRQRVGSAASRLQTGLIADPWPSKRHLSDAS